MSKWDPIKTWWAKHVSQKKAIEMETQRLTQQEADERWAGWEGFQMAGVNAEAIGKT